LGALASTVTDRNGNRITYAYSPTGLNIVDTLGRTISFSSIAQATDTITIPGMANAYQVHWGAETASASNNAVGVGSNPCVNKNVTMGPGTAVTSIVTPEGTYVFSYDPVYGTVNKITYPNGGYVRYVWGMDPQSLADRLSIYQNQTFVSCDARIDNPVITDRYVSPDGATETEHQNFVYATTWDGSDPTLWDSKTTTVTTNDVPDGTHYTTVYTYSPGKVFPALNSTSSVATQIPLATSITSNDFSGSTLESVNQQWETGYPFQLTQKSTSLNGIGSSLLNQSYNANEQLSEKDEWGYSPTGGAASLLRKTCTTYATFTVNPGIVDRPASSTVYDGSGGVGCGGSPGGVWASETDFGYDETPAETTNGVVQHDSGYGYVAGNLTSTHNFVVQGTSLTTAYTNDDTGQRLTSTDAANNTSRYSYTDEFASGTPSGVTDAYLTQATDGLGNITKYTWNYAGGTMASTTDATHELLFRRLGQA
jgi:hypothetical protein